MSCCKVGHSGHLPCLCHRRCQETNYPNRSCRCKRQVMKDYICIEWSVPHANAQTVFQTHGYNNIYTSGFIDFDYGNSDSVIVRFFFRDVQVGNSIRVFKGSSAAFSLTRFDRITVECPTSNVVNPEQCEGEISLVTRVSDF